ncbi:unnamed protein product [Schistocephalus solidus]|uniref:Uncharacterized protein n=1 Tax=Schistocephalus solidus TaxID=70667 RepID=A0A183ST58_SCHSO|nr:unnamed protein product [Schistocephalus solidus]
MDCTSVRVTIRGSSFGPFNPFFFSPKETGSRRSKNYFPVLTNNVEPGFELTLLFDASRCKTHGRTNPAHNTCPQPPRPTQRTAGLSPFTLAAWNVSSLLDNPSSNRPERRTALVAREPARQKVNSAALKETRFSEQGLLEKMFADYIVFWSGRPNADTNKAAVFRCHRLVALGSTAFPLSETI